ncbi:MAG: DUF4249 domain-containing protein [Clostridium sp.]|nr:DUF4249 domain-containing protein [Clostridium sp.]
MKSSKITPIFSVSLLTLLSLTGCFEDFDPDIASTPVLCMNSNIVPGDSIVVELTRTWRWDEGNPGANLDITVDDATITMTVNDSCRETLRLSEPDPEYRPDRPAFTAKKVYRSNYIPKVGDHLEFEAVSPKYGSATGAVTIPEPVSIDSVSFDIPRLDQRRSGDSDIYSFSLNLKVWLTDPSSRTDFYELNFEPTSRYDENLWDESMAKFWFQNFWIDYEREPLFTEHVSTLESAVGETSGYHIFSDRQISGQSYPLKVGVTDAEYIVERATGDGLSHGYLSFTLSTLSESYYKHVISVWTANDGIPGALGSVGLGSPVFESSNVSTGAGVISASSPTVFLLPMSEVIGY